MRIVFRSFRYLIWIAVVAASGVTVYLFARVHREAHALEEHLEETVGEVDEYGHAKEG